MCISAVLHSYKLTRFSNKHCAFKYKWYVLHSYKLTRFSNCQKGPETQIQFYTLTNLQGSQTYLLAVSCVLSFYTLTNLQGSQTCMGNCICSKSFTLLQTYKVLKRKMVMKKRFQSFTLLQTYKVLKPQMRLSPSQNILVICVSHLVMYKTQIFIY